MLVLVGASAGCENCAGCGAGCWCCAGCAVLQVLVVVRALECYFLVLLLGAGGDGWFIVIGFFTYRRKRGLR
jgi:hypothetical protein